MLNNKKILITGLISDRSIACGVASSCKKNGANLAFTYQNDKHKDRVTKLAENFEINPIVLKLDVSIDEEIAGVFKELSTHWDSIDGLLHSIAFIPKNGLSGDFVDNVDRETFRIGNDISTYSFIALARASRKMLAKNASLVCLSYLGAHKVVKNYNMAGVAKAGLESSVIYMADALGQESIRVNAISAGPIKTLAASGILGFDSILEHVATHAPLRRNITAEEVGNVASFLFSDMSSSITGSVIYADAGYNVVNL